MLYIPPARPHDISTSKHLSAIYQFCCTRSTQKTYSRYTLPCSYGPRRKTSFCARLSWPYRQLWVRVIVSYRICRDNCNEFLMFTHINDFVLCRPLFWLFCGPVEQPLVGEVSLLLWPQSGTACQKQSILEHFCHCSESHWRRNCSRDPTLISLITNCTSTWLTVSFFVCSVT